LVWFLVGLVESPAEKAGLSHLCISLGILDKNYMKYLPLGLVIIFPMMLFGQKEYIVCQGDSANITFGLNCTGKGVQTPWVDSKKPGRYFVHLYCIKNGDTLSRDSAYINIAAPPEVDVDSFPTLCDNDPLFDLTQYGSPKTGQWRSKTYPASISNNTVYPAKLKPGSHWLTYRYTDPFTKCYTDDSAEITIKACTNGLNEPGYNTEFKIHPVPCTNSIILTGNTDRITILKAVDALGRERSVFIEGNTIHIENTPPGLFYLRVYTPDGIAVLKGLKLP
jgi:hypothetical protein